MNELPNFDAILANKVAMKNDEIIEKMRAIKREEEQRFSKLQTEIQSNIEKVFEEKWDLMNRRVANYWKETTHQVLQVCMRGNHQ